MTDRPILFSAPMVLALLAGRKTQTRRILPTMQDSDASVEWRSGPTPGFYRTDRFGSFDHIPVRLPYARGDRLWVRESWYTVPAYDDLKPSEMGGEEPIRYDADSVWQTWGWAEPRQHGRHRSSLFMPRWASRLTLTVTDVRVQRLQEISHEDAIREGVIRDPSKGFIVPGVDHPNPDFPYLARPTAREMYAALWDVIHGSGAWATNQWIVAISFNIKAGNIDQ